MDNRDLAVAREIDELRVELRAEPASSEDLEAIAFHRHEHTACCFHNLDALTQEHARNILDRPRVRKRGRHVEQLSRQCGNALHFISETLKLRG